MDDRKNGFKDPFGVTVAGQLVAVQVGDDEMGRVKPFEGVFGIALIALQQQHVPLHLALEVAAGQQQGGHALDLVGALLVVDDLPPVGLQNGGDHLHGGGLSVGAGHGNDPLRQLHPAQHVGAHPQGKLAGQRTALAQQSAHKAQYLAQHNG